MIDLHSHLVPDFDDGVATVDHARTALRALRDAGVRRAVTTPHFAAATTLRPDILRDELRRLDRGWAALEQAAADAVPDLRLDRGVELRLDVPEPDLSDPRLRLAGTRAVLVEFDAFTVPMNAEAVIAGIAAQGWTPILAHPERYRGASMDGLRAIRDAGCHLQVNAGSITGIYGSEVRALAWALLRDGLVTVIASDYHGHREPQLARARAAAEGRLGEEAARLLCDVNGGRLLDGEPTAPVRPAESGGVLHRLVRWIVP